MQKDYVGNQEFLLTEIALNLLGNKFYDVNGKCANDLKVLYQLYDCENKQNDIEVGDMDSNENSLHTLLKIPESVLTTEDCYDNDHDLVVNNDEFGFNEPQQNTDIHCNENMAASSKITTLPLNTIKSEQDRRISSFLRRSNTSFINQNIKICNLRKNQKSNLQYTKNEKNSLSLPKTAILKTHYSKNQKERVGNILQSVQTEFIQIKMRSLKMKSDFLDTNKTFIGLKTFKQADLLRRFYIQQKAMLCEESQDLMKFIEFLKNSSEEIEISRLMDNIMSDVIKAKAQFVNDYLKKTNC